MVIGLLPSSGVKCQVGDFSVLVDAPSARKGNLILRTKTALPIETFIEPEVIQGSGEYEVSGVRIRGVALPKESNAKSLRTAYAIAFDDIHLGFLGEVAEPVSDESLDALGEVDILFLSADTKALKKKDLTTLVKQIAPRMIVPTDNKTAKLLAEELGQKVRAAEKLVVKKKDLTKEETSNKLVWLRAT